MTEQEIWQAFIDQTPITGEDGSQAYVTACAWQGGRLLFRLEWSRVLSSAQYAQRDCSTVQPPETNPAADDPTKA